MRQAATIQGRVRSVIYQSPNNPFRILGIDCADGRHTVKGREALQGLEVGEEALFSGRMVRDQRYGDQLEVADVRKIVPETADGLVRWLVQVGMKGIGEITARKLVAFYGSRTVDAVLDREEGARRLLGPQLDAAVESLLPHRAEERFGKMLGDHGIAPDLRKRIYETYGMQTEEIVRTDPYRVIAEIEGIGFDTADRIARAGGLTGIPPSRISAAIVDTLRQAAQDGHTALPFKELALLVQERAQIPTRMTLSVLDTFDAPGIEAVDLNGNPALALSSLARAERLIADRVLDKLDEEPGVGMDMAREAVAEAELQLGLTLNPEQRQAAVHALVCPISIMTGGPGTGKTTTLRAIVAAWNILMRSRPDLKRGRAITLGSPTGKAAKRMSEVTGIGAQTFHRLLETDPSGGFRRGRRNPLDAGLLACDEVSMADVLIFASVAQAWGTSNVLLVGDPDQLESVGAGRVFADLIACGEVPTTHLVEVRRQEKGSAIALGASEVKHGRAPVTTPMGQSDLVFVEQEDAATIAAHVGRLFATLEGDVQVLCPGHKSEIGTLEMNRRLQAVAAKDGPEVRISRGAVARKGDKVIQTDNDYDRDVFNGDTGTVCDVGADGRSAVVAMGGDLHPYSESQLGQLELAYALTVHKSQGSEYDVVVIPLHTAHYGLLKRTILYTAMTRAKKQCIIIGSRRAFARALANDEGSRRHTTLQGVIASMVE
jgi:exodeoxyribonuclease V alpha subunit